LLLLCLASYFYFWKRDYDDDDVSLISSFISFVTSCKVPHTAKNLPEEKNEDRRQTADSRQTKGDVHHP
jgi:hypothetical protein